MPKTREQWEAEMIRKYGSVEAGREEMRRIRSTQKPHSKGGFKYLKENDPDKLKEMQRKGGKARWNSESK